MSKAAAKMPMTTFNQISIFEVMKLYATRAMNITAMNARIILVMSSESIMPHPSADDVIVALPNNLSMPKRSLPHRSSSKECSLAFMASETSK